MPNDKVFEVVYLSEIDKNIERFVKKKKFRKLPGQIEELEYKLSNGEFNEPPIWRSDYPVPYDVYKIRMPNLDANEGKSNGYRVIYAVVAREPISIVVLITVYYKKEQVSVTETYIKGLIDGFFLESAPYDENAEEIDKDE